MSLFTHPARPGEWAGRAGCVVFFGQFGNIAHIKCNKLEWKPHFVHMWLLQFDISEGTIMQILGLNVGQWKPHFVHLWLLQLDISVITIMNIFGALQVNASINIITSNIFAIFIDRYYCELGNLQTGFNSDFLHMAVNLETFK